MLFESFGSKDLFFFKEQLFQQILLTTAQFSHLRSAKPVSKNDLQEIRIRIKSVIYLRRMKKNVKRKTDVSFSYISFKFLMMGRIEIH